MNHTHPRRYGPLPARAALLPAALPLAAIFLAGGLLTGCRPEPDPLPSPVAADAMRLAEQQQDAGHYFQALATLRAARARLLAAPPMPPADRDGLEDSEAVLQSVWGQSLEDAHPAEALPHYEAVRALDLALRPHGEGGTADVVILDTIAGCDRKMGRHAQAIAADREAVAQFDRLGHPDMGAYALVGIGLSEIALKRPAEALPPLRRSLAVAQGPDYTKVNAPAAAALGQAYAALRQPAQALAFYQEALALWQRLGDKGGMAQAQAGIRAARRLLQSHRGQERTR